MLTRKIGNLINADFIAIKARRVGGIELFSGHELDSKLSLYRDVMTLDSLNKLKEGEVSYVIFKNQDIATQAFAEFDGKLYKSDITQQIGDLKLRSEAVVYKIERISDQFERKVKYTELLHEAKISLTKIGVAKELPGGREFKVLRKIKSGALGDVFEVELGLITNPKS